MSRVMLTQAEAVAVLDALTHLPLHVGETPALVNATVVLRAIARGEGDAFVATVRQGLAPPPQREGALVDDDESSISLAELLLER